MGKAVDEIRLRSGFGQIRRRSVFLSEPIFPVLVKLADIFLITIASLSASLLYAGLMSDFPDGRSSQYMIQLISISIGFVFLFDKFGGYSLKKLRQPRGNLLSLVKAWTLINSIYFLAAFFLKSSDTYLRLWTVLWTIIALALMLCQRGFVYLFIKAYADSFFKRIVAVIGTPGDILKGVVEKLSNFSAEVTLIGVYCDDSQSNNLYSGTISDLVCVANQHQLDEIILAISIEDQDRIQAIMKKIKHLSANISLSIEYIETTFPCLALRRIGEVSTIEIVRRPLRHWGAIWKKLEDVLLVVVLLLLTGPLMGIIAILIRLDSPGPIFFVQERYGFNNRIIRVFKFRTMHVVAEDRTGATRTVKNDSRVTRVGRILRALSLDELPQIFNVLKGEMSFVGPRPHAVAMKIGDCFYHDAVAEYAQRHRVKPGIKGWAQINGLRGEVDTLAKGHARVEYDLDYIERCSLWLDLKILALTLPAVLSRQNAY